MLRDRDSVVSDEGIIFRVYGYDHPPKAYLCDVEYAPETIYRVGLSKALRQFINGSGPAYYKFYEDEGLRFVAAKYEKYLIPHEGMGVKLVGIKEDQIREVRRADQRLKVLLTLKDDALIRTLRSVLNIIQELSTLKSEDFGVFGSLQHGFYHPDYSDIDLVIYGRKKLHELLELLENLYRDPSSGFTNEYERLALKTAGKRWRFKNYGLKEFIWHQARKLIYGVYESKELGRPVKVEFEPVRDWSEIKNEYDPKLRIIDRGWIKAVVKVTDAKDSGFMPSLYGVSVERILNGLKVDDIVRVVSYVEEFRLQAKEDETCLVAGTLEKVEGPGKSFHQITLTRKPRYYEQVLKVVKQ